MAYKQQSWYIPHAKRPMGQRFLLHPHLHHLHLHPHLRRHLQQFLPKLLLLEHLLVVQLLRLQLAKQKKKKLVLLKVLAK